MHELRHMMAGVMRPAESDNPDIRILRRVSALNDIPLAPRGDGPIHRVAVVDTETTGTDPITDEVIDIAVVMLEVDTAGEIVGIASAGQALRDPGMPIPAAITRLTGIADEDVRGKAIDLDRLERLLASADVRLAHNARFDVAFVEALMPGLAGAAWGCSASDFDWVEAGFDGSKQGHLLMQLGFFNTAHRAMADVISLIHLLSHRLPHGRHRPRRPARQRRAADDPIRGDGCRVRAARSAQGAGLQVGSATPGLVARDRPTRLRGRGTLVPRTHLAFRPCAANDRDHLASTPSLTTRRRAAARRLLREREERAP